MKLEQIWQVLMARRRLFGTVLGAVLLVVLLVSLLMPRVYVAEASLVIDTKATDLVTGNTVPGQLSAQIIATQTDVIESHAVALKVVDQMALTKNPVYLRKFQSATGGAGSIRDWIADRLTEDVSVRPSRDSNVLNIDFPARDPRLAAEFANAFADAYVQTSLELEADPARRQARWFEEETNQLRDRVEAAQRRLAAEQAKTSIVGTVDHIDVDDAKLTEISTELVAAQRSLAESQTRLKQMNEAAAKGQLAALPDILSNPLLQTLKTDLARAEASFAEVAARYDRNHPAYQSAHATVIALRNKLATEIDSVRGGVQQDEQINQRQVDALQRALDQQKTTLIGAQRNHDSLAVLNREVDSAQRAYDAGLQRATQVRLESQLDASTVATLNAAVPPFQAARPKPMLYLLVALVFGSVFASGVCIAAEMVDRRVRQSADIVEATGWLVLAEVPHLTYAPVPPRRLRFT